MTKNSRLVAAVCAGTLAFSLAACGAKDEAPPLAEGEVGGKCTILQYETNTTAQYKGWEVALEKFKQEYPDLDVEWSTTSFDSIRANAKILLTGNEVPDVMLFNTGNADGGQLASQGLLTPLTDLVETSGWDKQIEGSVAALARYDEEGRAGSGDWYGVPNTASYFTFYYNKEMFQKQGIDSPPETFAELETVFDSFVQDGITPVSSNAGEHAVLQTWWQLISGVADREQVDNFVLLQGPVDTSTGAFIEGTKTLERWLEKGYLGEQLAGIKGDEMERAFIAGEFPIMANGTWSFSRVYDEAPFDWGTFTFPEAKLNAGASGHLWGIPTNAKNKACGEAWIAMTLDPEVQNHIASEGGIPVAGDTATIEDEKMRAINEQFDAIKNADALSFYPDYPVPGLLDFQMSELQALTNGSTDADTFMKELQKFYDEGSSF